MGGGGGGQGDFYPHTQALSQGKLAHFRTIAVLYKMFTL